MERLILKLRYFGPVMQMAASLERTLMLEKLKTKEKRAADYEMVGWHHPLSGHEFDQNLGDSAEQHSLVCCSPWGHKNLDVA